MAALALFACGTGKAATIFNDYPATPFNVLSVPTCAGGTASGCTDGLAASFTPGADFTLSSITLAFYGSGNGLIQLVDDVAGLPGSTVLESWTPTVTGADLTVNDNLSVSLSTGVTYWITATSDQRTHWYAGNSSVPQFSYSSGGIWHSDFLNHYHLAFDVEGTQPTETPEPASMLLIASGVGAIFAIRRRSARYPSR
jgi:hypothetical protein